MAALKHCVVDRNVFQIERVCIVPKGCVPGVKATVIEKETA